MEYDWQEESNKDILGTTRSTMKKPIITQTFDPCDLDAGDAAVLKIWNLAVKEQNVAALTNQDMLIVHLYAGTKDTAAFGRALQRLYGQAVQPWRRGRRLCWNADGHYIRRRTHGRYCGGKRRTVTFTADT